MLARVGQPLKGSRTQYRLLVEICGARLVQTSSEGPSKENLSAVAFQVTREQASEAFKEYHRGHFFATKPSSGLEKIKETFLPFWATRADLSVQLRGAQLGFDEWVYRWNPASKRSEPRIETTWQWVKLPNTFWEQRYTADEPGMQVYASYKYPRSEIDKLRPGPTASLARKFDGTMVVSDFDQSTRRVGPFQMKPATALRFAREWAMRQEERRAKEYLRASFRCDRIGRLDIQISFSTIRSSPLYVPAFVFRTTHFGNKLRTFVSGISASSVTGSRALDETRVGAAAGLVSGAMLVLSGYYASLTVVQLWWFGIALPAVVAGFAARYYTHARQSWTTFWSQREQSKQEAENEEAAWDPEWVKEYARLEEESRRREESESPGSFSYTGRANDHLGYYEAMGVQPNASKQEVQAAYRGLAMKYHPDRNPEAKKKEAERMFQKIQQAYSVLRDTSKRRQYDAGQ